VLPSYACVSGSSDVKDRVDAYMAASGISSATYEVNVYTAAIPEDAPKFNACVVAVEMTQSLPSLSVFGSIFGGGIGDVPVHAAAVMRTETQAAP
jgi:hypothetical protein